MESEFNEEIIEQVVSRAKMMLEDLDFNKEFEILELSFYNFTLKSSFQREFRALYLALWRFSLDRPFGKDNGKILYDKVLEAPWVWAIKSKSKIVPLAELYYEKLHERGKEDFTEIARHLMAFTSFDESKSKSYVLKLALVIRTRYTFFFDNLL